MKGKKAALKKLKKETRQRVYDKLVVALAEFKTGAKDKKFEKNLRRTSKLFSANIAKMVKKENIKTPKIPKKQAETKVDGTIQKTA